MLVAAFSYLAVAYVAVLILVNLARLLYRTFLAAPLDVSRLGRWAVVTGSTDGIGKAYAFAMAKRGLDVVLVSRSPFKLQNVSAEIESKYKVKTKIVDVDFNSAPSSYTDRLASELDGLEIGVLVNNVGMSYDYPEEFLKIENGAERVESLIHVNITSMNTMTRLVLPGMVERRKGAVINLSSSSALLPSPLYSVYAGVKAYVDKFTVGLELEYRSKGITIQCVLPGYVVSNMSKIRKASLLAPTPDTFVRSALGRLGVYSRTTGYWSHDLMVCFINMLPSALRNKVVFDQIKQIRSRALKKKERDAAKAAAEKTD